MYVQTFVAKISIEIKVRGKGNVDDTTLKFPLFRAEEKYRQVHLFPASFGSNQDRDECARRDETNRGYDTINKDQELNHNPAINRR